MKTKLLKKKVQRIIDKKVSAHSKHFSSEIMERQIEALIETIAPFLEYKEADNVKRS